MEHYSSIQSLISTRQLPDNVLVRLPKYLYNTSKHTPLTASFTWKTYSTLWEFSSGTCVIGRLPLPSSPPSSLLSHSQAVILPSNSIINLFDMFWSMVDSRRKENCKNGGKLMVEVKGCVRTGYGINHVPCQYTWAVESVCKYVSAYHTWVWQRIRLWRGGGEFRGGVKLERGLGKSIRGWVEEVWLVSSAGYSDW